jgi:hypothetical protein
MSQDRKTLLRLASSLPKGSDERRTLLAELQKESAIVYEDLRRPVRLAFQEAISLLNSGRVPRGSLYQQFGKDIEKWVAEGGMTRSQGPMFEGEIEAWAQLVPQLRAFDALIADAQRAEDVVGAQRAALAKAEEPLRKKQRAAHRKMKKFYKSFIGFN